MKETVFNITKKILVALALIQLGLSQVHIQVITKVFIQEIGFYLFLYILFGCVVAFNSASVKQTSNLIFNTLVSWVAAGFGIYYLKLIFDDIAQGNLITFADAQYTILLSGFTIACYVIGSFILIFTREKQEKVQA